MSRSKSLLIALTLTSLMVVGLSSVSAQQGAAQGAGNGYGAGNGQSEVQPGNRPGGMQTTMRNRDFLNLPAASADVLPQDIIDLMIAGWTDEQHAYAVYGSIIEQFGSVRPFANIQRSEAQHVAAWETLLERYDIAIPETPDFDLPEVASLSDACTVGAQAEVANFDLYDTMITSFQPYPDLQYVAQNLRDASEFNHLPAFENCSAF